MRGRERRRRTVVRVVIVLVASESGCAPVRRDDVGVIVVVLTNRLWMWVGMAREASHVK